MQKAAMARPSFIPYKGRRRFQRPAVTAGCPVTVHVSLAFWAVDHFDEQVGGRGTRQAMGHFAADIHQGAVQGGQVMHTGLAVAAEHGNYRVGQALQVLQKTFFVVIFIVCRNR